jgi:hypothetical protein
MGTKSLHDLFVGMRTMIFPLCGDGDGEPFLNREFPVAIPNLEAQLQLNMARRLLSFGEIMREEWLLIS